MNKEMLKGTIDILILSVLKEQDSYGYEISKTIKAKSGNSFEILEATMYLSLKRLKSQGFIEGYLGSETGGGQRRYFTITAQGIERLAQLSADWEQMVWLVGKFIKTNG